MVVLDRLGDVLQHHRLAGLRLGDDQAALALADRCDQVEDAAGDVLGRTVAALELERLAREQRGEVLEQHLVLRRFRRIAVDVVDAQHGEVALAFLRMAHAAGDVVAGAQVEAADLAGRDVDVVGAGQVGLVGRAQEAEAVLQDLQHALGPDAAAGAGVRLEHVEDHVLLALARATPSCTPSDSANSSSWIAFLRLSSVRLIRRSLLPASAFSSSSTGRPFGLRWPPALLRAAALVAAALPRSPRSLRSLRRCDHRGPRGRRCWRCPGCCSGRRLPAAAAAAGLPLACRWLAAVLPWRAGAGCAADASLLRLRRCRRRPAGWRWRRGGRPGPALVPGQARRCLARGGCSRRRGFLGLGCGCSGRRCAARGGSDLVRPQAWSRRSWRRSDSLLSVSDTGKPRRAPLKYRREGVRRAEGAAGQDCPDDADGI